MLPASQARARAPAAPQDARPGAEGRRARRVSRGSPANDAAPARPPRALRPYWMKGTTEARNARWTASWPPRSSARTAQSPPPSALFQPRPRRPRAESGLVRGQHAPARTQALDRLLPLCAARYLQPLCGGREGRRTRERGGGQPAHRARGPQAGHLAPGASLARRPRRTHDQPRPRPTPRPPAAAPAHSAAPGAAPTTLSPRRRKTLKYHPGFSARFKDIAAATAFGRPCFPWAHGAQRHSGSAMLTSEDGPHGRARYRLEQRERTLRQAWSRNPERFGRGSPTPQALPEQGWINPPDPTTPSQAAQELTTTPVSMALTGSGGPKVCGALAGLC